KSAAQELDAGEDRQRRFGHCPPGDRASAGHSDRDRARDRQVRQGEQAQEGPGRDPSRPGARELALARRASKRHGAFAAARLRRRAQLREFPESVVGKISAIVTENPGKTSSPSSTSVAARTRGAKGVRNTLTSSRTGFTTQTTRLPAAR